MNYIRGFDALRAISVTLVILAHLGLYHWLPENDYIRLRLWPLFSGETGVQIFFTLSGFLITRILLTEIRHTGRIRFKNFYVRRFLRLLPPVVILYAVLGLLMALDLIKSNPGGIAYSLFYIYNFIPRSLYSAELGHTWSLALEEQFYLIWPLILSQIRKHTWLFPLIAGILLLCVMGTYTFPKIPELGHLRIERMFIPAVGPIMIGSFFAILLTRFPNRSKLLFTQNNYRLLAIGLLLFLFPLYTTKELLPVSGLMRSVSVSLMLGWIVFHQENQLVRTLETKPLRYIGRISYGLYVYQGLFLTTGPSGKLWIQQFPQNVLLTVLTAILSFELIEKYFLGLKRKFRN